MKTDRDKVKGGWLDVGWVYVVVSVMCDVVIWGQFLNISNLA